MKDKKKPPSTVCFRNTIFGPVAVLWSVCKNSPKVPRILISKPKMTAEQIVAGSYPDARISSCAEINALADQIEAFLVGEDIRFSIDTAMVRLDLYTAFQQKVLRAEHAIPRGRISSYGLIAKYLNNPGGARAVGTALATNPFPILIPCHRAIRSDGALGGFQGGIPMKRALLKMEGVAFQNETHVVGGHFFYLKERE